MDAETFGGLSKGTTNMSALWSLGGGVFDGVSISDPYIDR